MEKIAIFNVGMGCQPRLIHIFGESENGVPKILVVIAMGTYEVLEQALNENFSLRLSDQDTDPHGHISPAFAKLLTDGNNFRAQGYAINLFDHGVRPLPEPGIYKILENGDFETVFKPE